MAVVPSVSYSQSSDGKTLTIIDTSDYSSGDITDYTREVEIWSSINGSGTLLYTLPFTGSELEVEQAITADQYFSAKLIFNGSPSVSNAFVNFTTQRFEQNALFDLNFKNCGCVKSGSCDKKFNGFIDMYLSQVATQAGNSALATSSIQASYAYLTS